MIRVFRAHQEEMVLVDLPDLTVTQDPPVSLDLRVSKVHREARERMVHRVSRASREKLVR